MRLTLVFLLLAMACNRSPSEAGSASAAPLDPPRADSSESGQLPAPDTSLTDGGAVAMPLARQRALMKQDSLWAEALRIHYNALVIDGHMDVPTLMVDRAYDPAERHASTTSHVDLPRMEEGGLDAAFFSIYVAAGYGEGPAAMERAFSMIEAVRGFTEESADAVLATTSDEVVEAARSGRKAILLGLEGGHATGGDRTRLDTLQALGVRYITLNHVNTNSFADASQAPPRHGGLTARGRRLVLEMNRLGILVDLSHSSDSTFYDALEVSEAPVILSHSSTRALVPTVRNASDEMLRALARNGGVAMINFFEPLVNPELTAEVFEEAERRLDNRGQSKRNLWNVVYEIRRERGTGQANLNDVLDHIDYAVGIAGIDHVGLGSDFDGVFHLPAGLRDVTRLPWITYGLLARGYTEAQIYKLLGGNTLRVLREAEMVADSLVASPPHAR